MIHYIYLRTSAQATEDPEKVKSSLRLFLPPLEEEDDPDIIRETVTSGYYGNQIIIMEAELKRKKHCRYVIDHVKHHLGPDGVSRIIAELPQRMDDDCNLYIRFNKQEASKGRMIITKASDAILIRIKLKTFPAKQEKAIQAAQALFTTED